MGSQSGVHDSSFMESQSLLDCSQSQQLPSSPIRNNTTLTADIPEPSSVTAPHTVETSSFAKVHTP